MKLINKIADIVVLLLFCFVVLCFSILLYVKYLYPNADYEQIIITIKDTPLYVFLSNIITIDYVLGSLFFIIIFPLGYFFLNRKQQVYAVLLGFLMIAFVSGFFERHFFSNMESTLYEDEYVNPKNIEYKFPKEKRNLLLIYLESFEDGFSNSNWYGKNIIANLEDLRKQGEFSREHKSLFGTNFSIAALFSSQCALPLKDIWSTRFFLPKVTCFPEILKNNGYQTAIVKAADITYTNASVYAKTHGYDVAEGFDEIKKNYLKDDLTDRIGVFGGVTDRTLYDYAKIKLSDFDKNKPFMLTLFSLDTHTPKYYLDNKCESEFGDIRDAFMCSDKAVADFIDWFKKSPYYDNTTIVIIGDHLLNSRIKFSRKAKRGIFNVFLNTPEGLNIDENKIFSTYDLAPTILEAMGIELKPRKFGLGVSLFDNNVTLVEKFGVSKFKYNLIKQSKYYDELAEIEYKRIDVYHPYRIGQEIKDKDFLVYTDTKDKLLDKYYIDRLNIKLENYKGGDLEVLLSFFAIIGGNSNIDISVNDNSVMKYDFKPLEIQPFHIKLDVSKEFVKDNKLQFKFNNSNFNSIYGLGISPLTMKIIEK